MPAGFPGSTSTVAPIIFAPVLLAEWKIEPDTGQRLTYRHGSLAPTGGVSDASGFAGLIGQPPPDGATSNSSWPTVCPPSLMVSLPLS